MNLADRINAVPVSAEDLLRTAAVIHRLPPETRDWQARARCALHLFSEDTPDKAYAVTVRLEAMGELVAAEALPEPFVPRASDGTRMLAESVFKAAAEAPVHRSESAYYFDRDTFVARIFEHADLAGDAPGSA